MRKKGKQTVYFRLHRVIRKGMWKVLSSAFGRVLMVLLVIAFAVWGVGDVFRRGLGSSAVATVGKESISEQDLQNAVRSETSRMQTLYGDVTPEMLASLDIERGILSGLINRSLLAQAAKGMGMEVSDAMVAEQIRRFPAFQNREGAFDPALFQQYLHATGLNEKHFIASLRTDYAIDLLIGALTVESITPSHTIHMLSVFEEEARQADILLLPAQAVKQVPEPSDAELIRFYEGEKSLFSAPEYREISYLFLRQKDAEKHVSITEEKLKAAYEERYAGHEKPEERELQQIAIGGKTQAQEIYSQLKKGKDFTAVAKEKARLKAADLAMGKRTRDDLETAKILAKEAIDSVFSLREGEFTAPIQTDLGWHIFRVVHIVPAQAYTFESVKNQLSATLLAELKEDALYALANRLEDDLAGGGTLEETAAALGLEVKKAGPFDANGKDQQNTHVPSLPAYESFLGTAFAAPEGGISELVHLKKEDAYYILRADKVIPPREKALDEVRGTAVREWKKRKQAEMLYTLAKETSETLRKKQKAGQDAFEATAQSMNATVTKSVTVKRPSVDVSEKAPAGIVAALFTLQPGEITESFKDEKGGYAIARLNTVIPPSPEMLKKREDTVRDRVRRSFQDDMLQQLVTYLPEQYPVEVRYKPASVPQQ